MTRRGFWTLGRKLVALLSLAAVLPVLFTVAIVYRQGRARVTSATAAYLGQVDDAAVQTLDTLNRRHQRLVSALVAMPLVRAQCPAPTDGAAELAGHLQVLASADPAIYALSLAGPDGRVILSADPTLVGVDVSDRRYYQQARAVDEIATEIVIARAVGHDAAIVMAQRFGPVDAPCVAIVAVYADDLIANVRALNAGMQVGGYLLLTDEHGIRIVHGLRPDFVFHPAGVLPADERAAMVREQRFGTRTEALLDDVVANPRIWQAARAETPSRDAWIAPSPATRERNLVVARRMQTARWTVFASVPMRSVNDTVASMLASLALVGTVLIAGAMLVGFLIARRFLRPIDELIRASRALAAGDSAARAAVDTRDEIGELARHFNRAADYAGAEAARREALIAERTRELTASNEELQRRRDELIGHRSELLAQTHELSAQRDELARRGEQVERADRMKSEFLANMSHELRTPLNSVIGFADLLQVTAEGRLEPAERGYLADIVAAGRHLLLIINDILDLAKIEAGHVRLAIEALDPEELAAGAIALALPLAKPRAIDLRLTVTARRRGRGDPDRLRQVLLNLLSNAVKFSPDGAPVDIRVEDDGDHLAFAVTDRGTGITAEAQQRLFVPFVQGEHPLVKRYQGTGLGLAISKKLVELHEGTLTVESLVGVGSTFRFTIPAAGRRASHTTLMPRGATVLLIGEGDALGAHRARLEPAGYQVVTAAPGTDLDVAARAASAALVVIDVGSLGEGDLADRLLAEAPRVSQQVPVILLSSEAEILATKPIDSAALQAICRRLVRRDDGPARLLVIDDDPRVAGLVAGALGSRYRIETAGTAAEGLAQARSGEHDLFVIDLLLPDGSGFDVLAALDADPVLRKVPRVVLTAAELGADDRERLRKHAHAVAHKGMVTPDELVHVVDRLAMGRTVPATAPADPQILVVDDNDMNRALARSILERLSYRVVEARDGVEAIAIAERERPALILMDLAMPGKDGFETTRELRAHPRLGATPIVAVSALAMRADEERARAAGVDSFLTKPLDRHALERTVARYLRAVPDPGAAT